MKLQTRTTMSGTGQKAEEAIEVKCLVTGITSALIVNNMSALGDKVFFEHLHPLAYYSNVKKLQQLEEKDLLGLDSSILAGIVLSAYHHLELMEAKQDAIISNAMLSSIHKDLLVKLILITKNLTKSNAAELVKFDIDYNTFADSTSTNGHGKCSFQENVSAFYLSIKNMLFTNLTSSILKDEQKKYNATQNLNVTTQSKHKISSSMRSDYEIEFDKEFIHNRKNAMQSYNNVKVTLINLGYTKLVEFLNAAMHGNNMRDVGAETKAKLIDRLNKAFLESPVENQQDIVEISNFIVFCQDEKKDLFKTNNSLLERASDSFINNEKNGKKKTFKEILADKKAQLEAQKEGN